LWLRAGYPEDGFGYTTNLPCDPSYLIFFICKVGRWISIKALKISDFTENNDGLEVR
jgi:hypothetical protein